jgi:NAD(P)H dehydrogenase (quinone)
MANNDKTLLVTGAGGHLGHRVVELLLESKAGRVIAASRSLEKLKDLEAKGAELRKADFDDPAGLEKAFAGVDRILIISTDAMDRPGRRLEQHQRAIAAAVKAGVKYAVYTSIVNPGADNPMKALVEDHRGTEQALAASGLSYTVLRNNWYAENMLPRLAQAVASGQLFGAAGHGATCYVTREDCARAAAAALASSHNGRQTLEISGPKAYGHADLASLASSLINKPVAYVDVPAEGFKASLLQAGLPGFVADLLTGYELAMAQGCMQVQSDAVAWLTGKKPQALDEFLAANKAALNG